MERRTSQGPAQNCPDRRLRKLPLALQEENGDKELFSVYVPTNHIYVGDIFLLTKEDIIRPNLSVREGLGEALCSCQCSVICSVGGQCFRCSYH